jgi:SAM-dependent methyltransferase
VTETTIANRGQIEGWNNAVGQTWSRFQRELDLQIAPIGARTVTAANIAPGETVLDIGCGAGAMTLDMARCAGPGGAVTGVDVSEPLLAIARERARESGAAPIEWLKADAQTADLGHHRFDVLASRFGVMFFDDPVAAFANLRKAARPGGRLAFACWRSMAENPWLTLPLAAAGDFVPAPLPAPPGAPGPFAFADADRVSAILADAGWSEVDVEPFDTRIGGLPLAETARLMTRVGPLGAALREAGADDALKGKAEAAVAAAIAAYETPDGVNLPSASWIVTAKA